MLTCGVGFGLQLVDDVFVGAGAGHPGVLGELRLHGEADPLLAQKPLQFLKRLQAKEHQYACKHEFISQLYEDQPIDMKYFFMIDTLAKIYFGG